MSISEHKAAAAPTSSRLTLSGRARHVSFGDDTLVVDLEDGRQIAVPLAWFPRLVAAGATQRSNWELVGRGVGISWPDIDEDISVVNLLGADGDVLLARGEPTDVSVRASTGEATAHVENIDRDLD